MSSSAIILGGTGGIGRALLMRLKARGLIVGGIARHKAVDLPFDAFATADARNPDELTQAVLQLCEQLQNVQYGIHCVGSIVIKPMSAMQIDDFKNVLDINLVSAFTFMKALAPKLGAQSALAFCSSIAGSTGLANHEAISAAKGGLEAMVRSAAASLATRKIRINAVAPTLTRTPLAAPIVSNELSLKASVAMIPAGRINEPDDVAAALSFLCSDDSGMINGQILAVDGGMGSLRTRVSV